MDDAPGAHARVLFRGPAVGSAVAVAGGVIEALGQDAVEAAGGPGATDIVDIGDGWLTPAFRDGHVHPLWGGQTLFGAPIGGATSLPELLGRVEGYAAAHPELLWVIGAGYDPVLLRRGEGDAAALDAVVADRPVVLWATDHHSAWVNSAALARAGVGPSTPDPPGGRIGRREDGWPSGALFEEAAHMVASHAPAPSRASKLAGLRLAIDRMVACGIGWAQDAALSPVDAGIYTELAAAGELRCRVNIALKAEPGRWRAQVQPFVDCRAGAAEGPHGVSVNTVKFFADGIIEAGTAALLEPYADDHRSCGMALWETEDLAAAATVFDAAGFQLHIHAIGDRGVRAALDAVASMVAVNGRRDRRPVIAHTQLVHPTDLPRFAALGVIANFEPLWAQRDPCMVRLTEPRLGPDRSSGQYPMRSLARLGTRLSFGSDWPVSSLNPLHGLAVAVTRQTRAGQPPGGWLPDQALPLGQALRAYQRDVAYQAFEEGIAGELAVGQRADLCLLGADLNSVAPRDIADVPVLGTWLAGREVYRADPFVTSAGHSTPK